MLPGIDDNLFYAAAAAAAAPASRKRFYLSGASRVAMGPDAMIMSDDLINFTSATLPWNYYTTAVAAGNDLVLATGFRTAAIAADDNRIARSTDGGVSFSDIGAAAPGTNSSFRLQSLCFGRGLFAYNTSTDIYTSPDGVTWTRRAPAFLGPGILTFQNNRFIHVGYDSASRTCAFAVSTDGVSWARGPDIWGSLSPGTLFQTDGVTLINGRWIFWSQDRAVCQIAHTTDLANFEKASMPWTGAALIGVGYLNGVYYVAGAAPGLKMATSTDLRTWTDLTPVGAGGFPEYFGAFNGRLYLASNLGGAIAFNGGAWSYTTGSNIALSTSTDGRTFSRVAIPDVLWQPGIAGVR